MNQKETQIKSHPTHFLCMPAPLSESQRNPISEIHFYKKLNETGPVFLRQMKKANEKAA